MGSIKDIFPAQAVEDNCIIHGDGSFTIGYIFEKMPEIYTLTPEISNQISNDIVNSLKILPKGTTFQKQDIYFKKLYEDSSPSYTWEQKMKKKHLLGRPILNHLSYIYLTFRENYTIEVKTNTSPIIAALGNIEKKPFKEDKFRIFLVKVENAIMSFQNSLNSKGHYKIRRLINNELKICLEQYWNLSFTEPKGNIENVRLQPLKREKGYFKIGSKFIKIISMTEESDVLYTLIQNKVDSAQSYGSDIYFDNNVKIKTSQTFPIGLGLGINHIVNTVITVYNNEEIFEVNQSEAEGLGILANIGLETAKNKRDLLLAFNKNVNDLSYQVCKLSVNIILYDDNLEKLNIYEGLALNSLYNMQSASGYSENMLDALIFQTGIPCNAYYVPFNRSKITTTKHAVCYIEKETVHNSDPAGHVYVDRYGKPVCIDQWSAGPDKVINSMNAVAIGATRTGKSFLLNDIIMQDLDAGVHCVIIDIGHSYKRLTAIRKGKYYDSSVKENLSFNLFLCEKDFAGNYLYKGKGDEGAYHVNYIVTVLFAIWKETQVSTAEEEKILKNMVEAFYEKVNADKSFPDFDLFYEYIEYYYNEVMDIELKPMFNIKSFKLLTQEYTTSGNKGYVLNAKENVNTVHDRLIVFDLESISKNDKKLFLVVIIVLINITLSKVDNSNLKDVRKTVLMDEGIDFLIHEYLGKVIAEFYRKIGKKLGRIILATQNVALFNALPELIRTSILGNSETIILMKHSQQAIKDAIQIGIIGPEHEEALASVKMGEFFMRQGERYNVLKHEVPKEIELEYTSWSNEKKAIDDVKNEYGCSDQVAIEIFVNKNKE